MRGKSDALFGALICAVAAYMFGQLVWATVQSPNMLRQALEALNVTFWFWIPVVMLAVFAYGTIWFLITWWRGNSLPNGEH